MSTVTVKLCGLQSLGDALAAIDAGADYLGFVFAESRRQVTPEQVRDIVAELPQNHPPIVGVFVNETPEVINAAADMATLDFVQLSGRVDQQHIEAISHPTISVVHVSAEADISQRLRAIAPFTSLMILDTAVDDAAGGSGIAFDWALAANIPADLAGRVMLAGGLNPNNVAHAISATTLQAVDVSSGIESDARKDPQKMSEFVAAAKSAEKNDWQADEHGKFGRWGGMYVPETLMPAVYELVESYDAIRQDPAFWKRFDDLCTNYVGRPTPLYFAERLTEHRATTDHGARIFLKREDLAHTGAHKINNALGQALLAQRMGKTRIIAETGAGQHGVATATACALLGLECIVFMGEVDIERQKPNVLRMDLLGAKVVPVSSGSKTLKDAINAAIRDWVTNLNSTYYLVGSVVGMHPYPTMVRDFQSVIGTETKAQLAASENRLPDAVVACVGGGSNAMGMFYPFLNDASVKLVGAEAGGHGLDTTQHAASIVAGSEGVLHGSRMHLLQTEDGQVRETHSISAGLDYPGVGPEHSHLATSGRAEYRAVTDAQALAALELLCKTEGIIPALESSHAVALGVDLASTMQRDEIVVVNLSGRGDKDLNTILAHRTGGAS